MPYVVNPLRLSLCALLLFLLIFSASHIALIQKDKATLATFVDQTLNYTKKVYADTHHILMNPTKGSNLCSNSDLRQLRDMLWDRKYLKDLGRVDEQGKVLCTANLGVLTPPVSLPTPTKVWATNNVSHWNRIPNPLHHDSGLVNIFAHDHTLALVSPYAYDTNFLTQPKNIHALLVSADLKFVFRNLGIQEGFGDLIHDTRKSSLSKVYDKRCATDAHLCVIGEINKVGFFGLSSVQQTLLIFLDLFITLGLVFCISKLRLYRVSMLYRLKKALKNNEFFLEYQPKFALVSGKIIGVEALIRWHDKRYGYVSPDIFIDLAESHKLMKKLTRFVIRRAIEDLKGILQQHPRLSVSINLSMENLSDKTLLPFINQIVDEHKLLHKQFIFEVTERSIIGFDEIEQSIKRFTDSHYQISLDDFGTGYANLSWLGKLNAHEVKVDKIFTQSIGSENVHSKTLNAIFVLLRELDVNVVFEGIETQEQADFIRTRFQHAIGQGWLFARSMPIHALDTYIERLRANS